MQLSSYTGKKTPMQSFPAIAELSSAPTVSWDKTVYPFSKVLGGCSGKYKLRHTFFSLLTLGSQQCSDLSLLISAVTWPLFLIAISPLNAIPAGQIHQ